MKRVAAPLLFAAACCSAPLQAELLDPAWTESQLSVNSGGSTHTGLAWAPDGSDRLFVIEKAGRVRILGGALSGTPAWSTFATMSPIHTNSECGLIGIAFDPDFASNHYVYFFVTVSASEQQIIRYDASTNTGTGRTVVVDNLPTAGNNHDGGGIGFAADGKLYWGIGDLGNGTGVDGNLSSLAAKVGRANRDGSVPGDNPFDDRGGPNNDYIFARGMRNPFTMQIQPSTGLIWLNVVGDGYEQIFIVRRGDHGGYNDYENNQPAPTAGNQYITPTIVYPTATGPQNRSITSATRAGGVATFVTSQPHRLRVGSNVSISGVGNVSFNGDDQFVSSVPNPTTFTVQQAGGDASSSGGNAAALVQGRCLTGGTFYESTGAPAGYPGNFFYGDCTSGRIMRAVLDEAGTGVLGVQYWATGINGQVDIAQGPDGALYYTGTGTSAIHRAAWNASAQGIVVDRHLRLDEGGEVVATVRLAVAPAANVTVNVARTAGDSDVDVVAGSSLVFGPSDWNRPKAVRITAAADGDRLHETATLTVSAAGLAPQQVTVHVLDLAQGDDGLFGDGFEDF